jgi:hypothetical protein
MAAGDDVDRGIRSSGLLPILEAKLVGGLHQPLSGSVGGWPEGGGAQKRCRELDVVDKPIDQKVAGVQHAAEPGDLRNAVHVA